MTVREEIYLFLEAAALTVRDLHLSSGFSSTSAIMKKIPRVVDDLINT